MYTTRYTARTVQVVLASGPQVLPGQRVQHAARSALRKHLRVQRDVALQHAREHLLLLRVVHTKNMHQKKVRTNKIRAKEDSYLVSGGLAHVNRAGDI